MKWQFALAGFLATVEAYTNESADNRKCFGKKVDLKQEPIDKTLFFAIGINKHVLGNYCREYVEPYFPQENYECLNLYPREGEYLTKVRWHKHDCYQLDNLTGKIDDNVTFQYYEVEEIYRSETIERKEWNKESEAYRWSFIFNWLAAEGITRPGKTIEEEKAYAEVLK